MSPGLERVKKELGWTRRYPTWCEGFPAAYRRLLPERVAGEGRELVNVVAEP